MTNQRWKAAVSASIGAAIAQHGQQRRTGHSSSWWLTTPRSDFYARAQAEARRMNLSRLAQQVPDLKYLDWPV